MDIVAAVRAGDAAEVWPVATPAAGSLAAVIVPLRTTPVCGSRSEAAGVVAADPELPVSVPRDGEVLLDERAPECPRPFCVLPPSDEPGFDALPEPASAEATAGVDTTARPTPSATADAPAQQIRLR
ncbi:hypothetical protein BayCH28_06720 [Mycolicibacterium sp. CH28]|uniref:hypothetical protein n=1 Tax=Mycolicibacterium sp. CH28 TaxID=2512237 RepID=UPI00107FD561|nr:hypothetical protein [Mycolicibacterium sp. CH28]TGD89062.1 hypothetical protein BayCH28_06720 [Mycolicibacterium sp. CH28]